MIENVGFVLELLIKEELKMPIFDVGCEKCEHVWEEIIFSGEELPTQCPECKENNCVKKLVSLTSPGKVKLSGQDYKAKIMNDAQQLKKEAQKNPNVMENL